MHKSLYEIQAEYAELTAQLLDADGELTPEMEMALLINQEELEKKAEAYALRIIEFNGLSNMIKAEAERLAKRAEQLDRTSSHLKSIIDAAMKQYNVDKIKTDKVTLSFRKSKSVEVPEEFADSILKYVSIEAKLNVDALVSAKEAADAAGETFEAPTEEQLKYFKLKAELSKTLLKEDLEAGVTIGDVLLIEKKNLQIK